jgi:FkbH-like protein
MVAARRTAVIVLSESRQFLRSKKSIGRRPTAAHRTPDELGATSAAPRRVLLIGACFLADWKEFIEREQGCQCDWLLANHLSSLSDAPPHPASDYDFQIIHFPLRSLMPETTYSHLRYADTTAHEALFDQVCLNLTCMIDAWMKWNRSFGIVTFVANFMVPQQNPMGKLLPRNDLRNMVYFVEQLNRFLVDRVKDFKDAYILDVDQISANMGRRYVQDDAVASISHNSSLEDYGWYIDRMRISMPQMKITARFEARTEDFMRTNWAEAVGMYRTLRQVDQVKLVVIDLDDTVWRGVIAEDFDINDHTTEGWPIGVAEALCFLKKRGIMLAIVSKNDEKTVVAGWDKVMGGRLLLTDFVSRKINWNPKDQNLREIMRELRLLQQSVVFIDDSPRERELISRACPGVRVLGADLFGIRSLLLWSPETQVFAVTEESERRAQMIEKQFVREKERQNCSPSEFIKSLEIKVKFTALYKGDEKRFDRSLELINKSNQFNTTGQRWTRQALLQGLAKGMVIHTFEVEDRLSSYGLVGVMLVEGFEIRQMVMSCRVIGLDVELATVLHCVASIGKSGYAHAKGYYRRTDSNHLCADLFQRCGFESKDDGWFKSTVADDVSLPIRVVEDLAR